MTLRKMDDPKFGTRLIEREPDALIDEKLFGYTVEWVLWSDREAPFRKGHHDFGMPANVPYYHDRIGDAWAIVEELRIEGIELSVKSRADLDMSARNCDELIRLKDEKYAVQIWSKKDNRWLPSVYGKTAPEAIAKAALSIVGP